MAKLMVVSELSSDKLAEIVREILEDQARASAAAKTTGLDLERCMEKLRKRGVVFDDDDAKMKEFVDAALTWKRLRLKKCEGSLISLEFIETA